MDAHQRILPRLLYSKREAAQMLGISPNTVTRDIGLGTIAARHYGRRVLIPREEIERIALTGQVGVATARSAPKEAA